MSNYFPKTGRIDSLKQAIKSFKEVFVRPKNSFTIAESTLLSSKYGGIDWSLACEPPSYPNDISTVDTTPIPLRKEKLASFIFESEYEKTYTTFSGADIVPVINGKIIAEFQGFRYCVDGNGNGAIEFRQTLFTKARIPESGSLVVLVFANDYGIASYETAILGELREYKSGISIDNIMSEADMRYTGKLVTPLSVVPDNVKNMDDDSFKKLVDEASKKADKLWIPEETAIKNNLANKVYYWVAVENSKKAGDSP